MNSSKFSLVLRQCRENAHLTQKQVAEALNVERSTYAYYETGTTHPSGAMIIKLAKIFNVSYSVFMDAVGDTEFEKGGYNSVEEGPWSERERIYALQKGEQNLLLNYRALGAEQKESVIEFIKTLQKENVSKKD